MNITIRQFVGGLVGGFVGILLFYHLSFLFALPGVLVGFFVGFYFVEVYQKIIEPFVSISKLRTNIEPAAMRLKEKCKTLSSKFRSKLSSCIKRMLGIAKRVLGAIWYLLRNIPRWLRTALIVSCRAISKAPGQVAAWYKADSLHRSYVAIAAVWMVLIATFCTSAYWLSSEYPSYHRSIETGLLEEDNSRFWFPAILACMMSCLSLTLRTNRDDFETRTRDRWNRGAVKFVIKETSQTFYAGLFGVILFGASIFGGIAALLFTALVVAPVVTIFIGLIRGLWYISKLPVGKVHILGLITTLIVTSITAFSLAGSLNNLTVWVASLSNGVICGLLSVGVYRLSEKLSVMTSLVDYAFGRNLRDLDEEEGVIFVTVIAFVKWSHRRLVVPAFNYCSAPLRVV